MVRIERRLPVESVEIIPEETDEEPTLAGDPEWLRSLARFEVHQARDEDWHWRLRHRSGNVIATGDEEYARKHDALKRLRSVMANATNATVTGEFTDE